MDVATWLRSLGLERHEAAFRDNLIDMDVIPELTENDLEKLGLALGDRKRVLKAIAGLPALKVVPTAIAPPRVRDEAERRPVTIMFCDLVGSTSLAAALDAEDWRDLVRAYLDDAARAVTQYGGHVAKRLGDGLMALFGYPRAQENDAERAARAGLGILRAIVDLNAANAGRELPKLSARIGLDSGPVVVDSVGEVFGDAPNVAARVPAPRPRRGRCSSRRPCVDRSRAFSSSKIEDRTNSKACLARRPFTGSCAPAAAAGGQARAPTPRSSAEKTTSRSSLSAGSAREPARGSSFRSSANLDLANRGWLRNSAAGLPKRRTPGSSGPPRWCCRTPRCIRRPSGASGVSARTSRRSDGSPGSNPR